MTSGELSVVQFCAEEVERQQDGPLAVFWMVDAWQYATDRWRDAAGLTPDMVERIGARVHPPKNTGGFRRVGVRVGAHVCPPHEEVPRLIAALFNDAALNRHTPAEVYKAFQEIHPFRDGNGRTGKIIFNWLSDTMTKPIMPPDFFGRATAGAPDYAADIRRLAEVLIRRGYVFGPDPENVIDVAIDVLMADAVREGHLPAVERCRSERQTGAPGSPR